MKNKNIIFIICVILAIILLGILLLKSDKEVITNTEENSIIHDENDISKSKEISEVVKDTTILGVVELNHNGYIYIFNGQHFGEYGFEMEEYNRANIDNKNQECIDYYTSEKFDTNYIKEGDIIICTGDLIKYKNIMEDDFDTKNNSIIVLKSEDYNEMKKETLNNKKSAVITVGEYYDTTGEIYVKYDITDKEYNLPFVLKFNIADDTQIIGKLEKGKKIKIQYKDLNVPVDELELKTIEVIKKQ